MAEALRRAVRRIVELGGMALAVVVALVLLGLPTWLVRGSLDLDRVEDEDLQGWRRSVHEAEREAWTTLQRALHESVFEEDQNRFRSWVLGRYRDTAPLRAYLRRNADALRLLDGALEAPRFELPARREEPGERGDQALQLGRLLRLRALVELEDGRIREAFEDALRAIRLGGRLESAGGATLEDGAAALSLRDEGLETVRTLAARSPLSAEQAHRLAERLEAERSRSEHWKAIFAEEYRSRSESVQRRLAGSHAPPLLPLLPRDYQYHPKRMQQRLADRYRRLQLDTESPCASQSLPEDGTSWRTEADEAGAQAQMLRPNGVGEAFLSAITPDHRDLLERRCLSETRVSATQAVLALRAHEAERGSLPGSLAELVPHYLPAVPRDGFDGEPLRYAPERRLVYSVGRDLRDAGGRAGEAGPSLEEPSFPIPPAAPAR